MDNNKYKKQLLDKFKREAGLVKVSDDQWVGTNKQWNKEDELEYQRDNIIECEINEIVFNK